MLKQKHLPYKFKIFSTNTIYTYKKTKRIFETCLFEFKLYSRGKSKMRKEQERIRSNFSRTQYSITGKVTNERRYHCNPSRNIMPIDIQRMFALKGGQSSEAGRRRRRSPIYAEREKCSERLAKQRQHEIICS